MSVSGGTTTAMHLGPVLDQAAVVLATTVDAPRQARAFVRETLARWDWSSTEPAVLMVSEAVAETVLTADSARLVLTVHLHADRSIEVHVHDDDPTPATASPRHSDYTRRVLDDVADDWGVVRTEDDAGKIVWLRLAEPRRAELR
jgi:hypothetical protein